VVHFDVPADPDSYIHRVGRTARAAATGDAFTFACPEEDADLRAIERAIGARLPRVILPGFDYERKPTERLEIPIRERLAAHRAQRRGAGARPGEIGRAGSGVRRAKRPPAGHIRESRVQAILDRHAPLAEAPPASRPGGRRPPRRRGA